MAWSKDNSVAAKLAAAEALLQAQRAELGADYIDEKQPLIDGFIGEQTNLQTQLDDLVLQSGTDIAEVVQARGGFPTVNARLTDTTTQLAETEQQLITTKSNPTNYSGAIVTIIDDDARPAFRTIWQPILDDTGVKIGIAAVKNWTEDGSSLAISELHVLQEDGHDILSHTVQHLPTYETSTTVEMLEVEYRDSKKWLKDNGFKGYDILVYPGGLDPLVVAKKNVARKYYRYAVTINPNYTINPQPLDNWAVYRVNADTSTETELKDYIDEAIANNGWLVFMTHSHVLEVDAANQVNKLRNIIAYCSTVGVPIMPFTEAEKYKGNSIAVASSM